MRANHRNTVRNQEPRIVCQREGYTIKRVGANDFDLYVYNNYIGSFPRQDEAERAGDAAVWELLKARAA